MAAFIFNFLMTLKQSHISLKYKNILISCLHLPPAIFTLSILPISIAYTHPQFSLSNQNLEDLHLTFNSLQSAVASYSEIKYIPIQPFLKLAVCVFIAACKIQFPSQGLNPGPSPLGAWNLSHQALDGFSLYLLLPISPNHHLFLPELMHLSPNSWLLVSTLPHSQEFILHQHTPCSRSFKNLLDGISLFPSRLHKTQAPCYGHW